MDCSFLIFVQFHPMKTYLYDYILIHTYQMYLYSLIKHLFTVKQRLLIDILPPLVQLENQSQHDAADNLSQHTHILITIHAKLDSC